GSGSTTGSLTGNITNSGTVAFNRSDDLTYSSVISGAGALTKLGAGKLTITGNQSYTGATTISGGTLVFNGTNTSTATTVNSGGTLGGSGSLGSVTIKSGGTVGPGNSPGTLTVGAVTFEGGGNYNWQIYDISGGPGIGWDLLSGTGAMTITATAEDPFNVNLWSLSGLPDTGGQLADFDPNFDYFFKIAEFASISGFAADKFAVNTAGTNGTGGFANSLNGTFSVARGTSVGGTANELYVVYAAIPEPATLTLAGIGLAAAAWAGRRRRGPACR
ncbi:MAG: autotransporter-associated beta strand repeat-containing protein, partial [Planctomycetaceae bacterium]